MICYSYNQNDNNKCKKMDNFQYENKYKNYSSCMSKCCSGCVSLGNGNIQCDVKNYSCMCNLTHNGNYSCLKL